MACNFQFVVAEIVLFDSVVFAFPYFGSGLFDRADDCVACQFEKEPAACTVVDAVAGSLFAGSFPFPCQSAVAFVDCNQAHCDLGFAWLYFDPAFEYCCCARFACHYNWAASAGFYLCYPEFCFQSFAEPVLSHPADICSTYYY